MYDTKNKGNKITNRGVGIKSVCVLKDLSTFYTVRNNAPNGRKHISVLY